MSVAFTESETRLNLMRAFAGESQARNRYTFAASLAKKKGLEVLEKVFLFTADQERAHGKIFYEFLEPVKGQTIQVDGGYPVDLSDDLLDVLNAARHNEEEESGVVYPAFAKTATQEGFEAIARSFTMIAKIEQWHARRFARFARLLEENNLFVSEVETGWMCLNCGHVFHSTWAPGMCPVCKHGQGFFVRVELAPWSQVMDFQN